MSNKIDKIVGLIGDLSIQEVKELTEKLGNIGLPPLSIGVPILPKTSPPTLSNSAQVVAPTEGEEEG